MQRTNEQTNKVVNFIFAVFFAAYLVFTFLAVLFSTITNLL